MIVDATPGVMPARIVAARDHHGYSHSVGPESEDIFPINFYEGKAIETRTGKFGFEPWRGGANSRFRHFAIVSGSPIMRRRARPAGGCAGPTGR